MIETKVSASVVEDEGAGAVSMGSSNDEVAV